jgi:hypothetical protein
MTDQPRLGLITRQPFVPEAASPTVPQGAVSPDRRSPARLTPGGWCATQVQSGVPDRRGRSAEGKVERQTLVPARNRERGPGPQGPGPRLWLVPSARGDLPYMRDCLTSSAPGEQA